MAINKALEKEIQLIRKYFDFLFKDDFEITSTKYDYQNFGNWIIALQSRNEIVRFYQDRGEIYALIGPPWASRSLDDSQHFFDLRIIVSFLEDSESIKIGNTGKLNNQLESLAKIFLNYYTRITSIFNDESFPQVEEKLKIHRQKLLSNFSPIFKKKD